MKKKLLKCLAIVGMLAVATLAAGAQAQWSDYVETRNAISATYDLYVKAVEALDAEAWLRNWDQDGVKFIQGAPAIVGKDAIGDFARKRFSAFQSRKMTIKVDRIDRDGNLALVRGTYLSEDLVKGAASAVVTDGWFLTVFKMQQGGGWKIYRDCIASEVASK